MSITKKQKTFIDEIFENGISESEAMEKYNISIMTYRKWLASESYRAEFECRIEAARRQSEILIARHSSYAAAKLINLADSEKEETARKACLDILDQTKQLTLRPQERAENDDCQDLSEQIKLSPEIGRKMLEILANPTLNQGTQKV